MKRVILGLALAASACGASPTHSTTAHTTVGPAADLANAKSSSGGVGALSDPRLPAGANHPNVVDLETIRIAVVGHDAAGQPTLESTSPTSLFERADGQLKSDHANDAINSLRQLVAQFPESKFAPTALSSIAAIDESKKDVSAAVAVLHELVEKYPATRDSLDGGLHLAALESEREHWPDAVAALNQVVARNDLTYTDRLEAQARLGYVEMQAGDKVAAQTALEAAVTTWKQAPHIDDPYYIGMAHYYLGELARRAFADAQVRRPETAAADDQLRKDLDIKEALGVVAYDHWKDALQFRNPYWATAAGYQMSEIFFEYWQATVKAPYPRAMDVKARDQYVVEVHHRVRDRLDKAFEGPRMNVDLARADGVSTPWSKASETRVAEIMAAIDAEDRGSLVHPSE